MKTIIMKKIIIIIIIIKKTTTKNIKKMKIKLKKYLTYLMKKILITLKLTI